MDAASLASGLASAVARQAMTIDQLESDLARAQQQVDELRARLEEDADTKSRDARD